MELIVIALFTIALWAALEPAHRRAAGLPHSDKSDRTDRIDGTDRLDRDTDRAFADLRARMP
jgi:hypothetical protein